MNQLFSQLEVVKRLVPEIEIFDRGEYASISDMVQGCVVDLEPAFGMPVSIGPLLDDHRVVVVEMSVVHAQRLEDVLHQEENSILFVLTVARGCHLSSKNRHLFFLRAWRAPDSHGDRWCGEPDV